MSFSNNDSIAKSVIVTEGTLRLNNHYNDDETIEERIIKGLDTLRVLRGRLILGFALSDLSEIPRNDDAVDEDLIVKCHLAVNEYCNEIVSRMIINNFFTKATESNYMQRRFESKLQNQRIISDMIDVEGNKMNVLQLMCTIFGLSYEIHELYTKYIDLYLHSFHLKQTQMNILLNTNREIHQENLNNTRIVEKKKLNISFLREFIRSLIFEMSSEALQDPEIQEIFDRVV